MKQGQLLDAKGDEVTQGQVPGKTLFLHKKN